MTAPSSSIESPITSEASPFPATNTSEDDTDPAIVEPGDGSDVSDDTKVTDDGSGQSSARTKEILIPISCATLVLVVVATVMCCKRQEGGDNPNPEAASAQSPGAAAGRKLLVDSSLNNPGYEGLFSICGEGGLEPGPSRARYFPRDMLLLTTTAREWAWRLLKITSQFFD